jgi:Ca-activated chloride channel homolog
MMEHFHFLRPGWLLLLPLIAGLVWGIARRSDAYRKWREFLAPHLLEVLLVDRRGSKRIRPITLLAVVLTLGIVALAGPTWRQQPSPFTQDTASLVIVLKVTPSMLTEDVQPSRLERTTHKIKDLLEKRAGSSAALIAYAGSAHLVMPLTRDANIIDTFATELHPDIMPQQGDDSVAALALAAKQLLESKEKGSILWIGDALTADEAADIAAQDKRSLASLIMLGAVGLDPDSTERKALQQSASALGARLEFIAPDERDIDAIAAYVEADFNSVLETEAGTDWQDEGYWLLFPIIALALFWFRPGWLVKYQ